MKKWLFLLTTTVLLSSCNSGQNQMPAPTVMVEPAQMEKIIDSTSIAASIQTIATVEILPRIEGYLKEKYFTEGQMVETNDPLYLIEPAQYEAMVAQKQADLAGAKAILLERTLNVERFRQLLDKRVVAKAVADQAESDFAHASAAVQSAEAALTDAKLNLSYTYITSPMEGQIGATTVYVGDYIAPGMPSLATIVQLDPIRAVFSVSERDWLEYETKKQHSVDSINDYLNIHLQLANGQEYPYPGEIDFIDNHINANTGAIAIYARFENPDFLLLPGQFVNVVLQQGDGSDTLTVPAGSVLYDTNGHYVLAVGTDNKVEKRNVTVGITQKTRTEITAGLNVGDQVITEGMQKVGPGMVVSPELATTPKE